MAKSGEMTFFAISMEPMWAQEISDGPWEPPGGFCAGLQPKPPGCHAPHGGHQFHSHWIKLDMDRIKSSTPKWIQMDPNGSILLSPPHFMAQVKQ